MKKRKFKLCILIILILSVVLSIIYVWQKNNIAAYITYKSYDSSDIERKQLELNKEEQKIMDKLGSVPESFFTEDQQKLLNEGKLSIEEAERIIEAQKQHEKDNEKNDNSTQASNSSRVSEIVASIYVLKADFSGRIDALVGQLKSEVASTPAENRTSSWKSGILSKYASKASSLEAQCDGKLNALLGELKKELKKGNQDVGMADEIRSLYYQEKANKKASVLSGYSSR